MVLVAVKSASPRWFASCASMRGERGGAAPVPEVPAVLSIRRLRRAALPRSKSNAGIGGRSEQPWGGLTRGREVSEGSVDIEVHAFNAVIVKQVKAALVGAPGEDGGQTCDRASAEPDIVEELAQGLADVG